MKTYTVDEIKQILELHGKWWRSENGGQRAELQRAYLQGAYLRGANLRGAELQRAYLQGAYLRGTKYSPDDDAELLERYFTIGPIGSRSDYLQVFVTNKRVELRTGCFTGSVEQFETAVKSTHDSNTHSRDYLAAVEFVKVMACTT
jgi:uncharacterized protein YjbI with pentapeptide repeats